jgi:2-polyprenyl-3-methyl-5-hydroxy-6-metoxy-1,4-benzoquinol methylase
MVADPSLETSYLHDVEEFMHGHRKKTVFFIDRLHAYARAHALEPQDVCVLELGCGNGRIVALPIAEQGFNVVGIDIHRPSIEDARAHSTLQNVEFACGDFRAAPQHGDFHAVILSDVLEHVEEPEAMLDVAVGALRSDGVVLVSIPNGYGPYEIEQFLIRKRVLWLPLLLVRGLVALGVRVKHALHGAPSLVPAPPAYNFESPHVQHFTLHSFAALLKSSGLRATVRQNGAWIGGDLTYFLFYFAPPLVSASLRLADRLPAKLVSTWYFECSLDETAATAVVS